jgi:Tfp pilus assembly protein PilX
MDMLRTLNLRRDERGLASFIVVVALTLIISLIILGFAQIVRRNQQQTLDRNLSSRAFYAAESGVNVAVDKMLANPALYPAGKNNCGPDATITASDYQLSTADETEVTCLTIDNAPRSLEYSNIAKQKSQVIPLVAASGNINSVTFSYNSTAAASSYPNCTGNPSLPADANWTCNAPMLRIDIVPTAGALSRNGLVAAQNTFFVYPRSGGVNGAGTYNYTGGANRQGTMVNALCNTNSTPRHCKVTVSGLSASQYMARVVSLYDSASLSVCANGCTVGLRGAQMTVDSTGRATDVARRIQVRVSLLSDTMAPDAGIVAAAGLCKRYFIAPGGTPAISSDLDGSPVDLNDPTNICGIGAGAVAVAAGPLGSGAADASTCSPPSCSGASGPSLPPPGGSYRYNVTLYNLSSPPASPLSITGCEWNFGDGSPRVSLTAAQCEYGDSLAHVYPSIDEAANPYPEACRFYTTDVPPREYFQAVLTQRFSDGSTAQKTLSISLPICF